MATYKAGRTPHCQSTVYECGNGGGLPSEGPEEENRPIIQLCLMEKQVLELLFRGLRRADIAEVLNLSLSSIKKNIESIYVKLRVNNMATAVHIARGKDLVPLYLIQTRDPHTREDPLSQQ